MNNSFEVENELSAQMEDTVKNSIELNYFA